jgi:hypothetical protein
MFGLISVLAFLGVFILMGMSAPAWNARTQRSLALSVIGLVALLYVALNVFWTSRPFNWESFGQY